RNAQSNNTEIRHRRLNVQQKMLAIHQIVFPNIKNLGIAPHKREKNITSTIEPSIYNHYTVGWIGVRYGKLPHEIDILNAGHEKGDDVYGFQKHACLQFN